ncbi:hypothetical protein [Pseudoalteromonas rubra]|uniref:hypothetical protein n=1 Tax=Pseudoalteromonas rubra TaxID=43658 RepID=UPI0011098420|nr:hypothetical protein [Pseudoalteromonas rubra]
MKKNIGLTVASLALTVLVGCKSTDSGQTARTEGYKCEQIRTLGSNIPKKRCTTKRQRDEIRRNGQESLRNSQRSGVLSGDDS